MLLPNGLHMILRQTASNASSPVWTQVFKLLSSHPLRLTTKISLTNGDILTEVCSLSIRDCILIVKNAGSVFTARLR